MCTLVLFLNNLLIAYFSLRQREAQRVKELQQRAAEEKEAKAQEYKQWQEERKRINAENHKTGAISSATFVVNAPKAMDLSLVEAKMEERRKRWMQECQPWRFVEFSCLPCLSHQHVI